MSSQIRTLIRRSQQLAETPMEAENFSTRVTNWQKALREIFKVPNTPTIVCLCGSTKFKEDFLQASKDFTKRGYIVLSVGWFSHAEDDKPTEEEKEALDELHKRKIDLADQIYVLNRGGYIGDSTRSEVVYAMKTGKPVGWLEPDRASLRYA